MGLEFYRELAALDQFEAISDRSKFQPLPNDWSVILTDIQGSTKAIEAGRYKDVNLIGAAAIAAVANTIQTRDFPFVFGGDGATLLLPNDLCAAVVPALQRLQRHARLQFDFVLRVGIVPMNVIAERGGRVLVSKFQVAEGAALAMFQGGGVQLAETIIKKDTDREKYMIAPTALEEPPPLESLSCRWAPIANRNGTVMSLLIQAVHPERAAETYRNVLSKLHPIFVEEKFKPISESAMRQERFAASWKREKRLRKDLGWSGVFWKILVPMIYVRVAAWFPFLVIAEKMKAYKLGTIANSDYRKLDDCLRMVLDCSVEQAEQVRVMLAGLHDHGEIVFGMHLSQTALMTCMMEGMAPHQHIHFIDGADGGYTMAAKAMKRQILDKKPLAPSG